MKYHRYKAINFSKIARSQDSRAEVLIGKSSEVVFVLVWREGRSGNFFVFFSPFYFPASGQAVVTGVVPSPPRSLLSIIIAHIGFSNPTAVRRFFIERC